MDSTKKRSLGCVELFLLLKRALKQIDSRPLSSTFPRQENILGKPELHDCQMPVILPSY